MSDQSLNLSQITMELVFNFRRKKTGFVVVFSFLMYLLTMQVTFDYPSEYITRVSGKYENIYSTKYLRSITFDTNRGRYGPFEAAPAKDSLEDTEFRYEVGRSKFGGFFGAFTSTGINSIGIYVKPLEKLVITPVKEE